MFYKKIIFLLLFVVIYQKLNVLFHAEQIALIAVIYSFLIKTMLLSSSLYLSLFRLIGHLYQPHVLQYETF